VHPLHSWTNLILTLIAFGLAVSAPTLGAHRGGLFMEPGRPDPGETRVAQRILGHNRPR
jgi:hypothetical protein